MAWRIQRENSPDEWLHIRQGRYIEWTKVKADALKFFSNADAQAFAEFYFGSAVHGHNIVGDA